MTTFGINKRVWDAVVGKETQNLERIVLAASQCAALLPDYASKSSDDRRGHIRKQPFDSLAEAERSDIALECHGDSASVVIRNALAEWATSRVDAGLALSILTEWDHKLGIWCACAVAETTFNRIGAESDRYKSVIEIIRRWVVGRATVDQVKKSARLAASASAFNTTNHAVLSLAEAVAADSNISCAEELVGGVAGTVAARSAAANYSGDGKQWWRAYDKELAVLCEVVAGAIHDFPADDGERSSGATVRSTPLLAGAIGVAIGAGAMHLARR